MHIRYICITFAIRHLVIPSTNKPNQSKSGSVNVASECLRLPVLEQTSEKLDFFSNAEVPFLDC